jgi:hypothetical protein
MTIDKEGRRMSDMPFSTSPASNPEATPPPAAATKPRTLGIVALVLALLPLVLLAFPLIVSVMAPLAPGLAAGLGLDTEFGLLGLYFLLFGLASISAIVALVLGIVATRTGRGRIAGVVAISLSAVELLLGTATTLFNMIAQAIMYG